METKHIERTSTYNVDVDQTGENSFTLVFRRNIVGAGVGNILATYPNVDWAIEAAKKFPRMYTIAQELGYSLSGDEFVNKDGRRFHVSLALDSDRSEFEFRSMLK